MEKGVVHVVLCEDSDHDRIFFQKALAESKFKTIVTCVNDGVDLMELLNDKQQPLPHIVFLDVTMPFKNGFECLLEIRASERLKQLSVAMYSATASQKEIEEAFIKGANVYIRKPHEFDQLRKVLNEVLSRDWQYQTNELDRDNFLFCI